MNKVDYQVKFGKHIRKVRKELKVSMRELELRSEIDRSLLSKIENGTQNPTVYTIHKIVEALDITIQEFYKGLK